MPVKYGGHRPRARKGPKRNDLVRLVFPEHDERDPTIDPSRAPSMMVRSAPFQPMKLPTRPMSFTSPPPMASTFRSFSQSHPMVRSGAPPMTSPRKELKTP